MRKNIKAKKSGGSLAWTRHTFFPWSLKKLLFPTEVLAGIVFDSVI